MQYIGVDIAKHTHVAASELDDGAPHGRPFSFPNTEKGFAGLLQRFDELGAAPDDCLIVMEPTGHYWMALWEFLDAHGFKVAVVNPVLTDAFRKADTLRKTKTDGIDALLIAEFASFKRLGPSRISPEAAEGLKQLTRYRHHLVAGRTSLKNRLTAACDRIFPELASLFSDKHGATAMALVREIGSARAVAATDIRTIERVARTASRGHHGRAKARRSSMRPSIPWDARSRKGRFPSRPST